MSKGVHDLANALGIVENAQNEDLSLDGDVEYEAVRVIAKAVHRLLRVHGKIGSVLLSLATERWI